MSDRISESALRKAAEAAAAASLRAAEASREAARLNRKAAEAVALLEAARLNGKASEALAALREASRLSVEANVVADEAQAFAKAKVAEWHKTAAAAAAAGP